MDTLANQCRRSARVPKRKQISYPPPLTNEVPRPPRKKLRVAKERLYDVFPGTNVPFNCDQCGSNWIIDPKKRKSKTKSSIKTTKPSARYKYDDSTGQTLTLCNSCGLKSKRIDSVGEKEKVNLVFTEAEKERYSLEAREFTTKLWQIFHTQEVEKLVCRNMAWKICGCIQMFIMGDSDSLDTVEAKERVQGLLKIYREAQRLSKLKYRETSDKIDSRANFGRVGLGNGRKKSELYQDYVLEQRQYLREHAQFCEKSAQQILGYSNNLLYRRLKTQENQARLARKMGKGAKELIDIDALPCHSCCDNNCVAITNKWPVMVRDWRERALLGQMDSQMVIGEMLTPAAGFHSNCNQFIVMVTGACMTTISKVAAHLRQTGGDRQPPEHGLKRYHHDLQMSKHNALRDTEMGASRPQYMEEHLIGQGIETDKLPIPSSDVSSLVHQTVDHNYLSIPERRTAQASNKDYSSETQMHTNNRYTLLQDTLPTATGKEPSSIEIEEAPVIEQTHEFDYSNSNNGYSNLVPISRQPSGSRLDGALSLEQHLKSPCTSKYTNETSQQINVPDIDRAPSVTISASDLLETLEIKRERILRMQLSLEQKQASLKAKQEMLEKQMLEAVVVKGQARSQNAHHSKRPSSSKRHQAVLISGPSSQLTDQEREFIHNPNDINPQCDGLEPEDKSKELMDILSRSGIRSVIDVKDGIGTLAKHEKHHYSFPRIEGTSADETRPIQLKTNSNREYRIATPIPHSTVAKDNQAHLQSNRNCSLFTLGVSKQSLAAKRSQGHLFNVQNGNVAISSKAKERTVIKDKHWIIHKDRQSTKEEPVLENVCTVVGSNYMPESPIVNSTIIKTIPMMTLDPVAVHTRVVDGTQSQIRP